MTWGMYSFYAQIVTFQTPHLQQIAGRVVNPPGLLHHCRHQMCAKLCFASPRNNVRTACRALSAPPHFGDAVRRLILTQRTHIEWHLLLTGPGMPLHGRP